LLCKRASRCAAGLIIAALALLLPVGHVKAEPARITTWVEHLALQVTRPPLDNVKLRQAIASAIDREAVMRAAKERLPGHLAMIGVARSWFIPGLPQHRDDLRILPHDPARARELLVEAGFPGGSGLPALEMVYSAVRPERRAAMDIIRGQLAAVGIPVEIVRLSAEEIVRRVMTFRPGGAGGDFSITIVAWGNVRPKGPYSDFLFMFLQGARYNVYGYRNAEATLLLVEAMRETDPARRIRLLQEAEEIILNEAPVVLLYYWRTR
jgi:ABC-type transport system substrate-binding protein